MTTTRVAHVAPRGVHPYSGLLSSLVHAAAAAARNGLEVEVWQLHRWPDEDTAELRVVLEEADVEVVPMEPAGTRWCWPAVSVPQIRSRSIDVAHLHGVFNPTNNQLARDLDVPYVVTPHGGYAPASLAFHRVRKLAYKHAFELPMLRRAAAVCALTIREAADIARFGVRGPVDVVPNGVPSAAATLDRQAFRHELGIGDASPLAVFAGRIDVRAKRLDRVVAAVAEAPGWHAALLGGDFRGGVAATIDLAGRLGVADRVHLPEPRRGQALDDALAAADVFVLMSLSEGMPMALLEAFAAGTPGVVSPEVDEALGVTASGAGWRASPDGLGAVLRHLATAGEAEWVERCAAARGFARRYDWAAVAASHEAIYRRIASR